MQKIFRPDERLLVFQYRPCSMSESVSITWDLEAAEMKFLRYVLDIPTKIKYAITIFDKN
jgi:hypothetical protein